MDKQRENGIYKFQAFEPGQIQMLDSYCLNAFEKETDGQRQDKLAAAVAIQWANEPTYNIAVLEKLTISSVIDTDSKFDGSRDLPEIDYSKYEEPQDEKE